MREQQFLTCVSCYSRIWGVVHTSFMKFFRENTLFQRNHEGAVNKNEIVKVFLEILQPASSKSYSVEFNDSYHPWTTLLLCLFCVLIKIIFVWYDADLLFIYENICVCMCVGKADKISDYICVNTFTYMYMIICEFMLKLSFIVFVWLVNDVKEGIKHMHEGQYIGVINEKIYL